MALAACPKPPPQLQISGVGTKTPGIEKLDLQWASMTTMHKDARALQPCRGRDAKTQATKQEINTPHLGIDNSFKDSKHTVLQSQGLRAS
jgi:hypothetical protein|mmetsp:Transcript_11698/g.19787  ORF Transcript_11698/g.19787 Transcript_11698/m.19787 type:complete len:90 (+) Transcript_11698:663-932(+)